MDVFYHSMTAVVIMGVIYLVFWLFTLIHAVRARYTNDIARISWILIVIFFQLVGPIIYWIFSRDHRRLEKKSNITRNQNRLRNDV